MDNFEFEDFIIIKKCLGTLAKNVRIVGGHDGNIQTHPFMVSFKYVGDYKIICGGSIISNKHILTSAQCVRTIYGDVRYVRVYSGIAPLEGIAGNENEIENAYIHPGFTAKHNGDEMFLHDIAVVKLKHFIVFNEIQNAIDLLDRDVTDNDSGFIFGWGSMSHPTPSYPIQMQKARMHVVSQTFCASLVGFHLFHCQFCTYNQLGIGPCLGDSGGPLVIDGKIAGIISVSVPCAQGAPDIYVRVYNYIGFIRDMMNI
ncbi:PREDICTED: chymotrypsin-1-like [Ceratosolen solmsi marchali]|uniref:Chymotrypsin-1-like n=1 Tax=Ceratosolen solmsi marchali TaxID=326594 RepID=A0AAJ6YUV8_9HYME|nr:PREDICTED: chymotrypsin-1-like [Ceratosolen solmsi marchali]